MMRLVALLLVLVASPLAAQTVSIRSGEHAEFTRLVLAMPEGREWRVGRMRDGAGYLVDLGEVSWNLAGAFDRIPRDRVATLGVDAGNRLAIGLGCRTCHANAFLFRPDRLVVDIVDGAPPADAAFETPLAPSPAQEAITFSDTLPLILPRQPALPDGLPPIRTSPDPSNRLDRAADAMRESLARAASHGIVDMVGTRGGQIVPETRPPDPPTVLPDGGPGVSVRTSLETPGPDETAPTDIACLAEEALDVESWVPVGTAFGDAVAAATADLTGEFDRVPDGAAESLARVYIHYGFGAEARAALALQDGQSAERLRLAEMARIVDGDPPGGGILAAQLGCSPLGALWSVLATGELGELDEAGREGLPLAYHRLPDALRGHLGARLSRILLEAGHPYLADAIQRSSAPAITGATPENDLAAAEVALVLEGPEPALEELEAMANDNGSLTPAGMIRLIELTLSAGRRVSDSHLALASAMRFEARGTPDEAALAIAEARGLIASDRFEEALSLAGRRIADLGEDQRAALRSEALIAMARRLPDAPFLEKVIADLPPGISAEAENAAADRLLALGFPDRAAEIVSGGARGEAMADRRLLRARAALALGDAAGAEEILRGMTGDAAQAIRARARQVREGTAPAPDAGLADGETSEEPNALWRAGDWAGLGSSSDPLLRSAAEAALSPPPDLTEGPPLAARRELLDSTGRTRAMVEALLDRFAMDGGS